ncbi:MAG: hypothetical protein WKF84_16010 [Pyrinomonadaceae bacterium]
MQPSDADLRAYYDSRQTDFRVLEDRKKIRYIFVDQAKVGEKLDIPDADLQSEYEKLPAENKQAGVRVRQIVLRVARPGFGRNGQNQSGRTLEARSRR